MLGRLLYKYKQTFGHGMRVAWYRDVVRQRILQTAPIIADDVSVCEIHVLTSKADWLNLVWTLKSFYHASGKKYGLCIHDDGTLTDEIRDTLSHHFPAGRILNRQESEQAVVAELSDYPHCKEFRLSNHLSPKVFDFRHHLLANKMLLLDSDVLFFHQPTELLRRIEDLGYQKNSVNADVASAYTVDSAVVKERCNVDLIERFNSGLGLIHRDSLNLEWIEEFLGLPNILGHFWRIEQTLYALCSSRFGVELLPTEYDVFVEGAVTQQPSRHYVGCIRHLMYSEGIATLKKQGMLREMRDARN